VNNYSIDNIDLVWLGVDLTDGLAQGTSVSETEGAGGWTNKSNAKGTNVVRVFNPEAMGTVSITIDQESLTHQQLLAIYNEDVKPGVRNKVGVLLLRDHSSGEEVQWKNAHLMKRPNVTRAVEAGTFVWVFSYQQKDQKPLKTLSSVVGD